VDIFRKAVNMDASQLVNVEPNANIPDFGPGDSVKVNFRIREGDRERVQAFQGVVIGRSKSNGPTASFTVRRVASGGIGIERIFPLHSPLIDSLEVTRQGSVRRAKLYYLRGLQGRAARIKEKALPRRQRGEQRSS
jgi:large subunit ribosomal protein L19